MRVNVITNRQIINTIDTYALYKAKMKTDSDRLKRILFYNGNQETDEVKKIRKQIEADSKSLTHFLDQQV